MTISGRLYLAYNLALEDLRERYRRSLIGLFWIPIGFLVFAATKIFIFGSVIKGTGSNFGPWLIIGLAVWYFISPSITDGTQVYVKSKSWIMSSDLPYSTYIFQKVIKNLINFFILLAPVTIIIGILGVKFSFLFFSMFIILLILLTGSAIGVSLLLAPICVHYRDLIHLFDTMMRVMIFGTPIIRVPIKGEITELIANINPFYHYIQLVRQPLLENTAPTSSLIICVALTVGVITAGFFVNQAYYRSISIRV